MLRVAIAIDQPRKRQTSFDFLPSADQHALDEARTRDDTFALVSCITPTLASSSIGQKLKLPMGQAALLASDGANWRLIASHAYPIDLPPIERWTHELAPGPFCH